MKRRSAAEHGPTIRARSTLRPDGGDTVSLLSTRQRQQLAALSTRSVVPSGRIIFREDSVASSLYFCREGALKTYRELPSGARRVTAFIFADDIFGLAEVGRYVNTARTLMPSTIYSVPFEVLASVLQQDADLEFHFLSKVTHELRESQHRAIMMGRRDAAGRLAMFLVMLRRRLPRRPSRDVIPLPMSRSDIAAYLGHSLEAVVRASAQLAKLGIVEFHGRHEVHVIDSGRLERLAQDV
jgi:CRP-like cAMP-binding protein